MNDDRFEQDLRSLLSRAAPADVPSGLREQVVEIPYRPRTTRLDPRQLYASALAAASVVAAVVLIAVAVSHINRIEQPGSGHTFEPSPTLTATAVVLPVNAPLEPTDCGWSATTPLAFAAYATLGDLDAGQIGSPNEHVYALVTRDPVEVVPMIGSPMLERGFCALRQDGLQTESAVGADWTFNGMQQNPVVTCEGTATSCVRETLAVLDAVASVSHPATRITFRADEICIGAPFGGRPCAAPAWPDGAQRMTSAVATFSGTEQQAFLNLFWLADGSFSADMMALEAPPLGATPFP